MKITKEQLKQIISEELEASMTQDMRAYPEEDVMNPALPGPYTSKSYRLISDYRESGWEAQRLIQNLYAKKDIVGLEKLADYADGMSLRKEANNLFLFAHEKSQPGYAKSLKKTQGHFSEAFRDAAANLKK